MARHARQTSHKKAGFAELLFAVIAFILLLVPSVGMLWAKTDTTSENRTLASAPRILDKDGRPNINILGDTGTYFEDHFAYRNQLVATNARLRAALHTSASDQVIVGKNNWLYYTGTLPDYLGQNQLSDRALFNIAHNLSLMQGFVQSRDAAFVFTIAPNKNTLYPQNMPSTYLQTTGKSNWQRLLPYLDDAQVHYVDMFDVLTDKDDVLYYARDTHWNNQGALLGGNALLSALGHNTLTIEENSWVSRDDYTGDIASMLYPYRPGVETALYAPGYNDEENQTGTNWTWAEGKSVEDDFVRTTSTLGGTDNLAMYRDSFANSLIPYFGSAFAHATFSKLIPYDVSMVDSAEADCVVVERAERHLDYLAQHAPIMPAPGLGLKVDVPQESTSNATGTTLEIVEDGGYTVVSGVLGDELCSDSVRIFIQVPTDDGSARFYEASAISVIDETTQKTISDYGYTVYLAGSPDFSGKTLRVVCMDANSFVGSAAFPM